jgi:replication-associated recombination protein RarA
MSNYQVKTKNGYDFFEASSAFQKSIRRGLEDETFFWAVELYKSNYAKYLWKRMIIIASEDVGLGDPDVVTRIMAMKASYDYLVKEKNTHNAEILPFIQAVLTLVNAKKSRYIDLAYSVYWQKHRDQVGKKQVPDFCLDMHTRRGKQKRRGLEWFYEVSALVNNPNKMPNEEEFEKLALEADIETDNNPIQEEGIPEDSKKKTDGQGKIF